MTDQPADYFFLPYLRQGLSTAVTNEPNGPRIEFDVTAHVEAKVFGKTTSKKEAVNRTLQLYGPGDILGFDSKLVVRTDPQPHVGDFESNYFPALEFAEPDFPWRFTPAPPSPIESLMPWIALIVLKVESPDGAASEVLDEGQSARNQTPYITVKNESLPDFEQSWRWAHVQMTPADENPFTLQALRNILTDEPERAVGRLLCARKLHPRSAYRAFVVPTFEVGRLAGLEQPIPNATPGNQTITTKQDELDLPYYYDWEFRTGSRGDFESLVRLLEPRTLSKSRLGVRSIRAQAPGYGLPGVGDSPDHQSPAHVLEMEGALQSIDTPYSSWGHDSQIQDLRIVKSGKNWKQFSLKTQRPTKIRIAYGVKPTYGTNKESSSFRTNHSIKIGWLENKPFYFRVTWQDKEKLTGEYHGQFPHNFVKTGEVFRKDFSGLLKATDIGESAHGNGFPLVGPPIYGQWHAKRSAVDSHASFWIDELNLDPRHRVAAGAGAQVVRDQQEALMASAWDQVGDVEAANELIRHAQLGCELSLAVHDRMQLLNAEDYLRVVSPTMKRIRWDNPTKGPKLPQSSTVYGKLLADRADLLPAVEPIFSRVTRPRGALRKRQHRQPSQATQPDVLFRLNAKNVVIAGAHPNPIGVIHIGKASRESIGVGSPKSNKAKSSRKISSVKNGSASIAQQTGVNGPKVTRQQSATQSVQLDYVSLAPDMFAKALNPLKTIPSWVNQHLQLTNMPVREKAQSLDLIMAAPRFPQPMYEGLREVSQELILPGLEKVPNNTLALLKPNMRFIEAYFCGLNHEFSKELEWREYPTDKRGSYFRQFWDVDDFVGPESVPRLHPKQAQYLAYQLGKHHQTLLTDEERLEEYLKDIKPITEWQASRLGKNGNIWRRQSQNKVEENLVLLIRGDLLRKYPNTVIYVAEARVSPKDVTKLVPALSEYFPEDDTLPQPLFPVFSAQLPPDLTFLGFDFDKDKAIGKTGTTHGYFFVLEERISETRFGLDVADASDLPLPGKWPDLSWGHFTNVSLGGYLDNQQLKDKEGNDIELDDKTWNKSSGAIAAITLQRPVRVAVHASQMLLEPE